MITGQTVSNTYQGDGTTRAFTVSFDFTDVSQVKAKVNGADITANFSVNSVEKTFTYPTEESGLIPLSNLDEIKIYRDTPKTQDIDFVNGGIFDAEVLEKGLDKLTMMIQEVAKSGNLVAGEGVEIEDGVISVKNAGVTVMPEGTDIDTLIETGVYIIKDPTSTKGLPMISNYGAMSINGKYAIVRVTDTGIKRSSATYFVYQELTLFLSFMGVDSIGQPLVYMRNLTDFPYTSTLWYSLTNELVTIHKEATESITLSVPTYLGMQVVVGNPYNSLVPSASITSLTILNYPNSYLGKTRVIFKAGSGFALTIEGSDFWVGTKPTTWTEGNIYMITIDAGVLRCESLVVGS